jgi:AAA domain
MTVKKPICDVVVLDTMASVTPGANENSAEDMGRLLQHCKFIHKETGALVILIAHTGKDASRGMRGWSGTKAAADAEIEIVRNGDYRVANVTKMKDGTDGESFAFKLKIVDLGYDSAGDRETSCVVEHVETPPEEASGTRKVRLGKNEQIMLELLKVVAPTGTVNEEDLIEGYKKKVAKGEGRDQRKAHAVRALTGLVAAKKAFKHGEDRWSLTSLITTGDDGWME